MWINDICSEGFVGNCEEVVVIFIKLYIGFELLDFMDIIFVFSIIRENKYFVRVFLGYFYRMFEEVMSWVGCYF